MLANLEQLLFGRVVVQNRIGRDQDMARPSLVFHDRLAPALVVQAHQVKSARAANRLRDLADLEAGHDVREQRRQFVALAPAQAAAFQRVLPGGIRHRQFREGLAGLRTAVDVVDPLLGRVDLCARRGGRDGDQDVRQPELLVRGRASLLAREEFLEFAWRDVDPADHVALAQLLDRELLAHVLAITVVVETLLGQHRRQVRQPDAVAFRDIRQRHIQGLVRNLDADALRALELDALNDQAFQHLRHERVHVGNRRALLLQTPDDALDFQFELAAQHDPVVDDRDDAVQQLAGAT